MELIDYTQKWLQSEIFAGKAIMALGAATMVFAFIFWRFGSSDYARALILPLATAGVIWTGVGASVTAVNHQRTVAYQQAYEANAQAFFQSEHERVEEFMKGYTVPYAVGAVFMVLAIIGYCFFQAPWIRATSVVLIYMALSLYTIELFSKERGSIYQQELAAWQK